MDPIIILGILLALLFNFANGLNDAANSIATIIATKALTPLQAVLLAGVFNLLGPLIFTTAIAATIGRGIVDPVFLTPPLILMAMVGAVLWVFVTSYFGIPVSSSHALIGGLLGAGIAAAGFGAVIWPSPTMLKQVAVYGFIGAILGAIVTGMFTRWKGEFRPWNLLLGGLIGVTIVVPIAIATGFLKISGILAVVMFIVISPMLGLISAFTLGIIVTCVFSGYHPRRLTGHFRILQIFAGSLQAAGHGGNDAQNAMGIITAMLLAGGLISEFAVPLWVILASSFAISVGTFFGGWRVVDKMATRITKIRPYQGFCASTAAGGVLSLMNVLGIPVSTTHAITGAIMGAGATRGYSAVKWGVVREILIAWILTIPAAAVVAGICISVAGIFSGGII
ncbi:MAG TPA: inorganic phosphate transporter [Candidatus Methanoculleus thermohydrogenotrophicum]|jgi:PiT family inorganic phosphate transporter|nr:inorganic phosphate transporter [Candidatus Methanoculleus thermohydrogenotrophicum]NLM81934.1 inorganic phosphate transporter [Candidatus Methanoculleus thermohydrogenotrophicum]HOB18605.1 inorganic phosphate transporter [Candidatus Methanoculleus thermohydrogenotrophicum]HPZ32602.1 inorganic phosphate transporter [Methanoculleus sp.]